MSLKPNFPTIRPSLLLDFANAKVLDPRITFTRTSTATYFDSEGVLRTAASGEPRFTFDPVTEESLGLLIEESRTNLFTYSDQFDNAAWGKTNLNVTANAIVAPDGALTSDLLIATSTSGVHSINETQTVTAASHTQSVYAKAGGYSWLTISMDGSNFVYYDLANGVLGNVGTNHTATITAVGNGWYRCTATQTFIAGTKTVYFNVASANGTFSFAGDGTSGLYIWGAQLEAGAFATSYIPTVAAQVTRAADSAVMTGTNFSSWFNYNESTFYAEAATIAAPANLYHYICSISLGTTAAAGDFLRMSYGTSKADMAIGNTGTYTTINTATIPAYTLGVAQKHAVALANNDAAASINGISAITTTARTLLANVDTFSIGLQAGVASNRAVNGTIKKLAYYPVRLSNAQLQALTA